MQGSHIFSKTIFHTFSIPNEKTSMPSLVFIFSKFCSWNAMQKTPAKLSSVAKNKIWINKWLNLEFLYFLNTSCTCWPNSILFQGLENQFHNSILFWYFQCRMGTLQMVLLMEKKRCNQIKNITHFISQRHIAQHYQRSNVNKMKKGSNRSQTNEMAHLS